MSEVAQLRRRNEELERAVREWRQREEELRRELDRTRERLALVEEAEERLCGDIGVLEAEAVAQAREHILRIEALSLELAAAHGALASAGLQISSCTSSGRSPPPASKSPPALHRLPLNN